ncbi:nitrogenase iron-molybdenum cofactor biosynthesis protein NifE [Candidatus Magnetominusculus dajiuhuensis]|uniref:nitrogenase iron-molybdenum cofactor biosynthesis protein NifE n=1 Tax=Candidatus Magnetominusculus dajiuhuensis TaxID=3137712 RepID=UPI003B42EAA5
MTVEELMADGCQIDEQHKVCKSRGGESCAFDGAMIVLQPIADAVHLVHGPVGCTSNTWEGRGTVSSKGHFHRMGFSTNMKELDIVFGSEGRLFNAIKTCRDLFNPAAVFVYATCVSGLTGEDIEGVCKKAAEELSLRVIPVLSPGFVGPKNLGNRIAGEVLLDYVIGTGQPPGVTPYDINLIGEYNIAGDMEFVEPVFAEAGIRILSGMTGNASFDEITYAHWARLNVVVCSRALINVAVEMKRRYKIPYVEVSFYGKTAMSGALRAIALSLDNSQQFMEKVEEVISNHEKRVTTALEALPLLAGKRAVLYTGGVKSWSLISALMDLGIEVVAVGTKKSTYEDEVKMRALLGQDAPLYEDVSPKSLIRLMREKQGDILVAGGRNFYLAAKEGLPFIDVNQERHTAYAGYDGFINLARAISNTIAFYGKRTPPPFSVTNEPAARGVVINPLEHAMGVGAVLAFQGIDNTAVVIHGAQGCTFLTKVLLTNHFKEPIALQGSKLFTEDVVLGSEQRLAETITDIYEKQRPRLIAVITTGLTEVKGDDVAGLLGQMRLEGVSLIHVPTPDYLSSLEDGYALAVEKTVEALVKNAARTTKKGLVNLLIGPHLTPGDFIEIKSIVRAFNLEAITLPDLSSLDGSRRGFSPLTSGGMALDEGSQLAAAEITLVIGSSMESPAKKIKDICATEYVVFEGLSSLEDIDRFVNTLSLISGNPIPTKYITQRAILVDAQRDAHCYYGGKAICAAMETDHLIQLSRLLYEMGAPLKLAICGGKSERSGRVIAEQTVVGDMYLITGDFDILITNSHGKAIAKALNMPILQMGFPVHKQLGYTSKVRVGYRGAADLVNEIGTILMEGHR